MSEIGENQQKFIERIAKECGFTNGFEIQFKGGTLKGDNYMGIVIFITIKDKNSEKQLNLVLKTAHSSENLRKQMPLASAYLREIYLYETVLPEFVRFQNEHQIQNRFKGIAKMYGVLKTVGSESILLEDLRTSGYKLWNRKLPMNSEHVTIVLQEYARYHAISFAYKDLHPEKFADLAKNLKDIFEESSLTNKEIFKVMMTNNFKKGYSALGDHPATKALQKFEDNFENFFYNQFKKEDNQIVVLHGDCWCNNLLFKYEDKSPTNVCIVDWQVSKMGSPVMDLSYFIYVCSSRDILDNVDYYLNIYYDTLSENIRAFGCDPKIYPLKTFKNQWQKFAKFGLVCAFSILPLMLSESKDTLDIAEIADSGKDLWEEFSTKTVVKDKTDDFNQRLSDIIKSMVESKVL